MKIELQQYERGGKKVIIREAVPGDAPFLPELWLQIDGEMALKGLGF
jgi:hypothetical protein